MPRAEGATPASVKAGWEEYLDSPYGADMFSIIRRVALRIEDVNRRQDRARIQKARREGVAKGRKDGYQEGWEAAALMFGTRQ